jgi:hypothetical protein
MQSLCRKNAVNALCLFLCSDIHKMTGLRTKTELGIVNVLSALWTAFTIYILGSFVGSAQMDWLVTKTKVLRFRCVCSLLQSFSNDCSFASDSKFMQKRPMFSPCLDSSSSRYALFWTKRREPTTHVGSALRTSLCDLYLGIFFQFFSNDLMIKMNSKKTMCLFSSLAFRPLLSCERLEMYEAEAHVLDSK